MGDRTTTADVQHTPTSGAPEEKSLLERTGFLDGMKSLRDTAGDVAHKGLDKSKAVYNDVKNSQAAGQIVDHGKHVITSPTTKRITGEVVQQGKEIGKEKVREVNAVVDAGKRGDVQGVVRNGAPLVRDVLIGPEALALKLAKDKAFEALIANAPPEKRTELIRAKSAFDRTSQIMNPSISNMIEDQLKKQAGDQALRTASDPDVQHRVIEGVKEGGSKAGQLFRGLGEKLHVVKPRQQAEAQRKQ